MLYYIPRHHDMKTNWGSVGSSTPNYPSP